MLFWLWRPHLARPATRLFLTKAHLIIAAFVFPAIAMFLATGALYTWGNTGEVVETEHVIQLDAPLAKDEDAMLALATRELARLDLSPPSGKDRIRSMGDSWSFEWTGAQRDITIAPGESANQAVLTVKEASLHRVFVQLHKAKGSTLFKVYASVLAAALLLLVASGLAIGLMVPAFRGLTIWTSGAGLLAFVGAVALG